MLSGHWKAVRERLPAARGWPLWELPRWLIGFITVVVLVAAGAIVVAGATAAGSVRDLLLVAALLVCTAATVELTRRSGENAGVAKDVYAVWELPLAILLPPVFALLVPYYRFGLAQLRIRRSPLHRRILSASVVGLSYASASLVFHALTGTGLQEFTSPQADPARWVLAVAAAAATQWAVNTTLLLPAIRGADPTFRVRDLYLDRERVRNDVAEVCVAVLVTLAIAITPLTIIFAFPFVTLLQHSFRHAQLVNASRMDSKTGLLNAGTWEREAAAEVARAVRTRTPVAVALLDIDHFKAVNDTFGHLSGDEALRAIARAFHAFVRDYDLVGRFGGEEFALLLPQTTARDARRIAERIRAHIGAMPIDVSRDLDADPVRLTVSVGVAAVGPMDSAAGESRLTDLLAAADSALYQAKQAGRDQVCVIADDAGPGPEIPARALRSA